LGDSSACARGERRLKSQHCRPDYLSEEVKAKIDALDEAEAI
jgi:hypothetical protein